MNLDIVHRFTSIDTKFQAFKTFNLIIGSVYATDYSNASSTGLFDPFTVSIF